MTLSIKLPTAFAPLGEAAPLLAHLAGEFAPRIAGVWPAPHAPFLTLPAERRHLIFLALSVSPDRATGVDLEALLALPLKQAARFAMPDPPAGIVRALGRLGEVAWSAEDYRLLVRALAAGQAGKRLRHAAVIDAALVRALAGLPDRLIAGRASGIPLGPEAALLIAESEALIRRRDGPAAAEAAVAVWADCASAKTLFEEIGYSIQPELPPPPFEGTERLTPIRTKAEMREAGRRYRNCLAGLVSQAAGGWTAFFVWRGQPEAIVQVIRDPVYGWRLEHVRLARNQPVPPAMREAILAELAVIGVEPRPPGWQLEHALHMAGAGQPIPARAPADLVEAFGE